MKGITLRTRRRLHPGWKVLQYSSITRGKAGRNRAGEPAEPGKPAHANSSPVQACEGTTCTLHKEEGIYSLTVINERTACFYCCILSGYCK
jgi:hypothetical protein